LRSGIDCPRIDLLPTRRHILPIGRCSVATVMKHLRPIEVHADRQKVADDWMADAAIAQLIAATAQGLPADRYGSLTTRQESPSVSGGACQSADACCRLAGG